MFGLSKKLAKAEKEIETLKNMIFKLHQRLHNVNTSLHDAERKIEESEEEILNLVSENAELHYRCYQLSKELSDGTGVPEKGRWSFETACPEK